MRVCFSCDCRIPADRYTGDDGADETAVVTVPMVKVHCGRGDLCGGEYITFSALDYHRPPSDTIVDNIYELIRPCGGGGGGGGV